MSTDDKPEEEAGGLTNEPLPGAGAPSSQPEKPAEAGQPSPPAQPGEGQAQPPPPPPAQPPAGTPAAPPPPPAAAAPAGAAPAAAAPGVAPAKPGQPGLAIASFVCSIVGILLVWCCGFGGLLSIAAIVTGLLAKGEVEKRGAPSWMWITGVALGALGLVILLIWAIAVGINFSTDPNWDVETT